MVDQSTVQYYREREAEERSRAARATDPIAEKLHLDLAGQYARVVASQEELERLGAHRTPTFMMGEDDAESSPERRSAREH